ncbi:DUF885 domain-containing protein [Aggregicoccus sp. 17bor-14]|uniref:DUF885 domain-containing protein n=1 Tax=Myxococcaceae TaxID=31 RepID=UPI00129C7883|nr:MULTISPECIES: DUF885 domain-containing protein [Myxococcaceae]MBF5044622.1 DUF885 domain-containing protein [Simulacricoccus sp. 17bor-14]MRI90366.1 DUF885 domain-containing protein [Aggregicoccus sp. 17bor-14]
MPFCRLPRACAALLLLLAAAPASAAAPAAPEPPGYTALLKLFEEWRSFVEPARVGDVPDYRPAAIARKAAGLPALRKRLEALDTRGWTRAQQVDLKLVRAEMNGLDFELRVLRPWARDPAFYATVFSEQSDTPAHEGRSALPAIELWAHAYPLPAADQGALARQLEAVAPLLVQARENLKDGDARELWLHGAGPLREQAHALAELEAGTLSVHSATGTRTASLEGATPALRAAVAHARTATEEFAHWVEAQAPRKKGPSGVGKENYTWYLRNVHLVPYTWEDEVALLRRELERAHASLRLEEYHNRALPPLEPAASPEAFAKLEQDRLEKFVRFLTRTGRVIPERPYVRAALAAQLGPWVPPDKRNFFLQVTHREPMLLLAHQYHWLDLARLRDEPHASPIRRVPSLFNIWDSRAEGFATAFEELTMQAGLYDDNPRARELVWVMLANRAARGLASLYVQANALTLVEAGQLQQHWTPRGWAPATSELTATEQLLYLRQPGYGTSYVSGKALVDRLIAQYAREHDPAPFDLREFMAQFNDAGLLPVSLLEEQLTEHPAPAGP